MSGIARESSSGGNVAPEELLLGSEDSLLGLMVGDLAGAQVLLGSKDSLLSLEVGNFAGAHVGRDTALGKQDRGFRSGMSIESRSVQKNMDISTLSNLNLNYVIFLWVQKQTRTMK